MDRSSHRKCWEGRSGDWGASGDLGGSGELGDSQGSGELRGSQSSGDLRDFRRLPGSLSKRGGNSGRVRRSLRYELVHHEYDL